MGHIFGGSGLDHVTHYDICHINFLVHLEQMVQEINNTVLKIGFDSGFGQQDIIDKQEQ